MGIQEILTYLIVAASAGYVLFKVVRLLTKKTDDSNCQSMGCSGCEFNANCVDERKE